MSKKLLVACIAAIGISSSAWAQLEPTVAAAADGKRALSLEQAVQLGIKNSKNITLANSRVQEAIERFNEVEQGKYPSVKASVMYTHAEIPERYLGLFPGQPLVLPKRTDAYIANVGATQLIYGGGKLRYAAESTKLLQDLARLDVAKNEEDIRLNVITAYLGLNKVLRSQAVLVQNYASVSEQLTRARLMFKQGVITKNDVLRFQLQQDNVRLQQLEMESNKRVVNYNLGVLLGLPDGIEVQPDTALTAPETMDNAQAFISAAIAARKELEQLRLQRKAADLNVKTVRADQLPTLGAAINAYYIDPNINPIPKSKGYITPITGGLNLGWNIGNLWSLKPKIRQAELEAKDVDTQRDIAADGIKREVNANYEKYRFALDKERILYSSIAQAEENHRIIKSKYANSVASAVDVVDAETLLFQSKINYEIAKIDAQIAYYTLIKSTGKL